ncbi:RGCVC family protein [Nocardia sp. alder85J]|uniref:RGCVC family protein n=1 Tax=Nocardia sp. alder85J TaxID=2862949 RepID=UPI002250796C|nr:RGCVC family protein [Nocardia sp. alder85J]MCX4093903.1 RGCVC family protein [Nocardia sp. alder85J]
MTSLPIAMLEFDCPACDHTRAAHGHIGFRYCAATMSRGLLRECACARDTADQITYYRR